MFFFFFFYHKSLPAFIVLKSLRVLWARAPIIVINNNNNIAVIVFQRATDFRNRHVVADCCSANRNRFNLRSNHGISILFFIVSRAITRKNHEWSVRNVDSPAHVQRPLSTPEVLNPWPANAFQAYSVYFFLFQSNYMYKTFLGFRF